MANKKPLSFAKKRSKSSLPKERWKVLIVDDEESVHTITKTVLHDLRFEEKAIEFLSAFSAKEAREVLESNSDIALILLDVVMEDDDAGLELSEYVREVLDNHEIRIVLRTGQPGQAPEREVIAEYDINDYKEKTELTADKLYTTVIASIRNYRDLLLIESKRKIIEQNKLGLQQIINSSASLFEMHSLKEFSHGVLLQLISILKMKNNSLYITKELREGKIYGNWEILAATGDFEHLEGEKKIPKEIFKYVQDSIKQKRSLFVDDVYIGYFESHLGHINMLYLDGCHELVEHDRQLIEIFSSNVSIAFENIYLDNEIIETQRDVINTLGEVVESRSPETANHVKRVAEYSYLLANKCGLSKSQAERIKGASPLHDIGKIGIRDSILLKSGRLDDDEFEIMKHHAKIGYDILKRSTRHVMKTASVIAFQHHEKFNGKGYPQGLVGEQIDISARIVAIADVFDAISQRRCYKEAWSFDNSIKLLVDEKGKHFDPRLIDLFVADLDELREIIEKYR